MGVGEDFNNKKMDVIKMIPTVLIWNNKYQYKFIVFKERKGKR